MCIRDRAYINDKAASSIVKGYQPQFPFDTDLIKSEEAVMELYKIGRDELTGADAERDYIRVELFEPVASKENTFKARKFRVAVEVASCAGAGGETIKVKMCIRDRKKPGRESQSASRKVEKA